jgi:transcriptional regulator with XRE-family HTH domain
LHNYGNGGLRVLRDTDVHIGRRLRQARLARGLSQDALGKKLGITYQQVQKYETGANRIGGSRLWDACRVLDMSVGFFFEGLSSTEKAPSDQGEALSRRCLALARDIEAIRDDMVKSRIAGLVRAIARPGEAEYSEGMPDGS